MAPGSGVVSGGRQREDLDALTSVLPGGAPPIEIAVQNLHCQVSRELAGRVIVPTFCIPLPVTSTGQRRPRDCSSSLGMNLRGRCLRSRP